MKKPDFSAKMMQEFWPDARIIKIALVPGELSPGGQWDPAKKLKALSLLKEWIQNRDHISEVELQARLQAADGILDELGEVDRYIVNDGRITLDQLKKQLDDYIEINKQWFEDLSQIERKRKSSLPRFM